MSGTAAPASTTLSRTVRSEKKGLSRWITSALTPSSRTRTLDPPPRILKAMLLRRGTASEGRPARRAGGGWRNTRPVLPAGTRPEEPAAHRRCTVPGKSSNECIGFGSHLARRRASPAPAGSEARTEHAQTPGDDTGPTSRIWLFPARPVHPDPSVFERIGPEFRLIAETRLSTGRPLVARVFQNLRARVRGGQPKRIDLIDLNPWIARS